MKLRQSRSRQTREQILGAARELFARQGYEPTSIDQIASAAKVAKSSVFAHFGDKTNLLAALGLAEIEKLAETAHTALDKAGLTAEDVEFLRTTGQSLAKLIGASPSKK